MIFYTKKSDAKPASSMFRALAYQATATVLLTISGCGAWLPEMEPYGAVRGVDAVRSLNGLAIHREMWESAGARCVYPQKLSPRLETVDVIVLVGKDYDPPARLARKWLEDWLGGMPGRTVIYFGRGFSAAEYYRIRTLSALDESQRKFAKQALAGIQAEELNQRLRQVSESTFCDWFFLDIAPSAASFGSDELQGPWSSEFRGLTGYWPLATTLQEPLEKWRQQTPSWITQETSDSLETSPVRESDDDEESLIQRSVWEPRELSDSEAWDAAFKDLPESTVLLSASDGRPFVFRLEDQQKYPGSQILIVANGAPFLNASLVDSLHRSVGGRIVEECLPAERVALLSFDQQGLVVSSLPETDSRGAGLEVLTVWPLSAITMPAALLGIVVCAALFPVLGRPQRLPKRSVSDFGLHVEALGRMLQDTGDVEYAKGAVRDYFEKVRGEVPPRWLAESTRSAADSRMLRQPSKNTSGKKSAEDSSS